MTDVTEAPPIACTLDTGAFRERQGWIAELNATSLLSCRRDGLALTLEYDRRAIDDVQKFVRGERACCGFLDFVLQERGNRVIVAITAPEAAADTAGILFQQFESKTIVTAASSCGCASAAPVRAATRGVENMAASKVAAIASVAALACGLCCVLPFALPAAMLGSIGGVLAWFSTFYRWLVPIAVIAVAAGWVWVWYQSWRYRRKPAWRTLAIMGFATVIMAAAWMWPAFESTARVFLKAQS